MSKPKKYYWLKLKEDFFDDETIRYIEEQPNGILYSNFYLKLCLKSLKTNGKLIRIVGETVIPYDDQTLSRLTGVPLDTVRCGMALFNKIGLVKVMDSGELYLKQLDELVGAETDKAALMRRRRAEQKAMEGAGVTMLPDRYPETRDRELENRDSDIRELDTRFSVVDDAAAAVRNYVQSRGLDAQSFLGTSEELFQQISEISADAFAMFGGRRPTPTDTMQVYSVIVDSNGEDAQINPDRVELLLYAMEQAACTGCPGNWNYITGVLANLSRRGITTLTDAEAYDERR